MEKACFILICFSVFLFFALYIVECVFCKKSDNTKNGREAKPKSEDIELHVGEDIYYLTIPKPIIIRKKKKDRRWDQQRYKQVEHCGLQPGIHHHATGEHAKVRNKHAKYGSRAYEDGLHMEIHVTELRNIQIQDCK